MANEDIQIIDLPQLGITATSDNQRAVVQAENPLVAQVMGEAAEAFIDTHPLGKDKQITVFDGAGNLVADVSSLPNSAKIRLQAQQGKSFALGERAKSNYQKIFSHSDFIGNKNIKPQ